jgi:hypothetical protein
MKKSVFASILMVLIGGSFASSVIADDTLVRFRGAIGDIPVANVAQRSLVCCGHPEGRLAPDGRRAYQRFAVLPQGNSAERG